MPRANEHQSELQAIKANQRPVQAAAQTSHQKFPFHEPRAAAVSETSRSMVQGPSACVKRTEILHEPAFGRGRDVSLPASRVQSGEFPLPIGWGEGQGSWKSGEGSVLQLEHLTLLHTTLRQELIKRTLQTLSDDEIQTMTDAIQHQIEKLSGKETR